MAEANSFNTDLPTNTLPTELANELINDGLRQFWEILLTSNDSDMQKMSHDVLNGYYLHLPELSKEHEFINATSGSQKRKDEDYDKGVEEMMQDEHE